MHDTIRERARGCDPVDAGVSEKTLILSRDNGVDHAQWHFVDRELTAESLLHPRIPQRRPTAIDQRDALHRRLQQRCWNREKTHTAVTNCQHQNRRAGELRKANDSVAKHCRPIVYSKPFARTRSVSVTPKRSG